MYLIMWLITAYSLSAPFRLGEERNVAATHRKKTDFVVVVVLVASNWISHGEKWVKKSFSLADLLPAFQDLASKCKR